MAPLCEETGRSLSSPLLRTQDNFILIKDFDFSAYKQVWTRLTAKFSSLPKHSESTSSCSALQAIANTRDSRDPQAFITAHAKGPKSHSVRRCWRTAVFVRGKDSRLTGPADREKGAALFGRVVGLWESGRRCLWWWILNMVEISSPMDRSASCHPGSRTGVCGNAVNLLKGLVLRDCGWWRGCLPTIRHEHHPKSHYECSPMFRPCKAA